jgi:hypothetical protein
VDRSEISTSPGLAYWRHVTDPIADTLNQEAFATLVAQPRFTEACLKMVRDCVDDHFNSPLISRATRDMRRFFAGLFMLQLDAEGEVTLATVKALCRDMGLASPGRAAALLIQLRLIGFIVPAPVQRDRRARRFVPSSQMRACFDAFFRSALEAAVLIEPEAGRAAEQLDDPKVYRAFLAKLATGIARLARTPTHTPLTIFARQTAGMGVLYQIALSGDADDTFPPRGRVKMPVAGLARQFKVSRAHVLRMLKTAEAEGSLRRERDSTGLLHEPLRRTLLEFWGVLLLGTLACAHAALEAAARDETTTARPHHVATTGEATVGPP